MNNESRDARHAQSYRLLEAEWMLLLFERENHRPAGTIEELNQWATKRSDRRSFAEATEAEAQIVARRRAERIARTN